MAIYLKEAPMYAWRCSSLHEPVYNKAYPSRLVTFHFWFCSLNIVSLLFHVSCIIWPDYIKGLEKECRDLRQRNRDLEQDADATRRFGRAAPSMPSNQDEVMTEVKDNAMVKKHIQSLNEIIGKFINSFQIKCSWISATVIYFPSPNLFWCKFSVIF